MQKRRLWRYTKILLLVVSITIGSAFPVVSVMAQTSSSDNYQVTETQFNSGTSQQSCSGQYCARTSIGNVTDGKKIVNSTAAFEDVTNDDPLLELIIEAGESNLGVLTTETTATKITTVRVRNHQSGGYLLQIIGAPPKFGDHTLYTSTTAGPSIPGQELFGINVVANSAPNVGADPVQVPSGQAIFGVVEGGYNTTNRFKYSSEDVIARSAAETGRTDYTITMIVNISNATPAGKYTGDFAAIVVPIY